jgi:CspA family cold shock protein
LEKTPSPDQAVPNRLDIHSSPDIIPAQLGEELMAYPTKGYGFIQPQGGGGKDVFVHISAVERAGLSTLNEGQGIEYEIESSRGKESAINLKVK